MFCFLYLRLLSCCPSVSQSVRIYWEENPIIPLCLRSERPRVASHWLTDSTRTLIVIIIMAAPGELALSVNEMKTVWLSLLLSRLFLVCRIWCRTPPRTMKEVFSRLLWTYSSDLCANLGSFSHELFIRFCSSYSVSALNWFQTSAYVRRTLNVNCGFQFLSDSFSWVWAHSLTLLFILCILSFYFLLHFFFFFFLRLKGKLPLGQSPFICLHWRHHWFSCFLNLVSASKPVAYFPSSQPVSLQGRKTGFPQTLEEHLEVKRNPALVCLRQTFYEKNDVMHQNKHEREEKMPQVSMVSKNLHFQSEKFDFESSK